MIIDLSANNAHPVDYGAVAKAGIEAAIIKATEGTGYSNPFFGADISGFAGVGIPTIAYHFASFGDVQAEVAWFKKVAGAKARVLDSETSTDAVWQQTFLDSLDLPPNERVDYGSASFLPRTVTALLWVASYGKDPGWGDFWQYTSAGTIPGIDGPVDVSKWTGSQADFESLFGITPPSPQPPAQESVYMIPTNCPDHGSVSAQIREWWGDRRSDPVTQFWLDALWYAWHVPVANGGLQGNPDLLLAHITDTAGVHLRPQYAGAV